MGLFDMLAEHDHEQVVFCHEPSCGYRGIIAIHDTTLGPALGGTRFWNYASDEEAVIDALRLSRGMTYKASVAGLNLGGGKAVIIGDPKTTRRETIFRAHGRFVESLGGRYITAEDVGTSVDDITFTSCVGAAGTPRALNLPWAVTWTSGTAGSVHVNAEATVLGSNCVYEGDVAVTYAASPASLTLGRTTIGKTGGGILCPGNVEVSGSYPL